MSKNGDLKHDTRVQEKLLEYCKLNKETGEIEFNVYAYLHIWVGMGSLSIHVPYSHLVWFLKHKKWPKDGYNIDHIDDDSLNNHPDNLQELTKEQNNAKKRGRGSKKYGTGRYGHGIGVSYDKKRNKYKVYKVISKSDTGATKSQTKVWLFREDSLENAEDRIEKYIVSVKQGSDFIDNLLGE